MTKEQFEQYLMRLGLTPAEAAQLLSVSPRTVRRWQEGFRSIRRSIEGLE